MITIKNCKLRLCNWARGRHKPQYRWSIYR